MDQIAYTAKYWKGWMIQIKLVNVMIKSFHERTCWGKWSVLYLSSTKKILGIIDPYWLENQSSERNQMSHWRAPPCRQQCCHWKFKIVSVETIRTWTLLIADDFLTFKYSKWWTQRGFILPVASFAADVWLCLRVANTNSQWHSAAQAAALSRAGGCRFLSRLASRSQLWVLWAATATIRLTFHLPLSFKPIVHVLKIGLAKICPSPSFECYLVE